MKSFKQQAETFVYCRLVQVHKNLTFFQSRRYTRKKGRKFIVRGKPIFWTPNHPTNDRLMAYEKDKTIRQFSAAFQKNDADLDVGETNIMEAVENIIAHSIQIDKSGGKFYIILIIVLIRTNHFVTSTQPAMLRRQHQSLPGDKTLHLPI